MISIDNSAEAKLISLAILYVTIPYTLNSSRNCLMYRTQTTFYTFF